CVGRRWLGDKHPNIIFAFLAGIAAGINTVHLELLIGRERRNQLTLATVSIKLPAVVATFDLFSVKTPAMQRHAAMWAGILQRERAAFLVSSDDQRQLQQRCFA